MTLYDLAQAFLLFYLVSSGVKYNCTFSKSAIRMIQLNFVVTLADICMSGLYLKGWLGSSPTYILFACTLLGLRGNLKILTKKGLIRLQFPNKAPKANIAATPISASGTQNTSLSATVEITRKIN